ncbi:HK97 gp10 family phage protein [Staphylococcus pseudintermedius]|uniref:HK97-gp10 family putative phage morphogenesis protein n=1 Tax=Staphylococcus pseudintermedius TaxID=283734 RepID=UPI001A0D0F59|nr:HK97-gp10 family putative phage morphogenesis protein [Staphylococcus pseudintermedius]EGQ3873759.1 HK97 gp10 family phage protein [Staphylococcus pseudintermedius]EKH2217165.1 HK97 gp10 family phage protein [Staphylococcus pseudintermedius]ELW0057794.1 HK97 gp10 family phage protein [Staphylococcus pseudintermedius]MDT0891287.1 HK97 gp10 family phage protein [Staphylococcus pseudintermedius]HDV6089715.1 HK97 gp10 family phage protein [Staphylococcus pseudintermedius]
MPAKIERNDIEQGLMRQQLKFRANQKRILLAGALSLVPDLVRNTPVSGDTKRHAKDHIAVSNVKTDRASGESYVNIGYTKGYAHRIHATEFGTMYQQPQLFITKTEKANRDKVFKAMSTAFRRLNI